MYHLTVDLLNSTIREYEQKGKYNVEITPAPLPSHKKTKSKDKKYVFQFENEFEQLRWVKALERGSKPMQALNIDQGGSSNPIHKSGSGGVVSSSDDDYMMSDSIARDSVSSLASEDLNKGSVVRTLSGGSGLRISESMKPTDMAGYMMKKSPALMKGWQKRYFRTMATGDVEYYKSVGDEYHDGYDNDGDMVIMGTMMVVWL